MYVASALMKMIPEPGTTRAQRAAVPEYSVATPSSRTIWRKHCAVLAYRGSAVAAEAAAEVAVEVAACSRVLTTSKGCVSTTEESPA